MADNRRSLQPGEYHVERLDDAHSRVSHIEGEMKSFATKDEVAEIRGKIEGLATKEAVERAKNQLLITWIGVAVAVGAGIIPILFEIWPR